MAANDGHTKLTVHNDSRFFNRNIGNAIKLFDAGGVEGDVGGCPRNI